MASCLRRTTKATSGPEKVAFVDLVPRVTTSMLTVALPVARALGIDSALITCDEDNIASRKVIEANGGVLEDKRGEKLRFWVPTS